MKSLKTFLVTLVFLLSNIIYAQTYNFTNAGASGRFGPSQAQLDAAYGSTNLSGNVTSNNGIQLWTVPASGTYLVTVVGASGGRAGSYAHFGRGAKMEGEFYLVGGQTLKILVGQEGQQGTNGGCGGGGSFVALQNNTPLIVAGGGSGGGNYASPNYLIMDGRATSYGPNYQSTGRATAGGGGGSFNTSGLNANGGASFISGGNGGAGSNGVGGFGGGGGSGGANQYAAGGGGYSGGDEIHGTNTYQGSEGGGGSYNSGDNKKDSTGINTGHGRVIIHAIAVGSADIEAIAIVPVTNVPFSMCNFSEHEFDITLKNNGPDDASFIDFKVYMEGMDSVSFVFFDILDLLNGQTKTYRISTKKMNPKKPGNFTLTFEIVKVMSEDDDPNNNIATANINVNNLPHGSELTPSAAFPGFPKGGDKFNPDHITYNKTYRYIMSPPTAFNNGNFGTSWDASFQALLNGSPLPGSKYNYTESTGGNDAYVDITLAESELDAELQILYTVYDLTGTGCDTTSIRYARVMPSPKLAFEGTLVCEGDDLQFVNRSSVATGTNTYVWTFGDGNGSVLFEPKHRYQSVGIYQAKLVATTNLGFTDSLTLNVEVNPTPVLDYIFQNQCGALPVVFQNNTTVASGNMTYTWDFGDGSSSNDESPSYTYPSAGPYEVTLSVETDKGCYSELKKSAYSYPTPTVNFNTPTTVCAGDNISLQNSTTIPFSTWGSEWTIGNSKTRTFTKSPNYVFKEFGEQPVKLRVTTQYGCVDSLIKMITVDPGPAIDITHSDVCSSGPVIFNSNITVPQGMTVNYIWNIAGTLYAEASPVVNFGASGTKNISVEITYANGCKNNASTQVITGYRPNASFDLPEVICSGEQVLISNNTTIEFGNPKHTWIMGDGSVYTDVFVPNHIYSNTTPEDYTVTLISSSSSGQCPDTASYDVSVGVIPTCDFDIIETYLPGHRGFTFVPTQQGANYQWFFGDGRTSNNSSPVYQFSRDGNFQVRLLVTTEEGCQCESTVNHSVMNLSTSNISSNGIIVYPNPSTGLVNISNTGDQQIKTIKVMNSIGAIILNNTVNTQLSEYTLDLNNVSAGVYMVTIETMDGRQFVQRVIIAK